MTTQEDITVLEAMPNRTETVQRYIAAGISRTTAEALESRAERIRRTMQRTIVEIGRELLVAHEEAVHGTWGVFLERIDLTESTARNYMNVARRFADAPAQIAATVASLPPKLQYTLAAPSADPAIVGEIIAEAAAGAPLPPIEAVRARVAPKPTPTVPPVLTIPSTDSPRTEPDTKPAPSAPPVLLVPTTTAALPPPLPGFAPPAATIGDGFDQQQRKLLLAKYHLLSAALTQITTEVMATTGPTIVINGDRIAEAAHGLVSSPALAGAAALLALSATVEPSE